MVQQDYLKAHGQELVEQFLDSDGRKGLRVETFPSNAARRAGL